MNLGTFTKNMNIAKEKPGNDVIPSIQKEEVKKTLAYLKRTSTARKQHNIAKKCIQGWDGQITRTSVISPYSTTYLLLRIRKCFLRHRWQDAARLLILLLKSGRRIHMQFMLKSCFLVLLNHPDTSRELREEFLRVFSHEVEIDQLLKFSEVGKEIPNLSDSELYETSEQE